MARRTFALPELQPFHHRLFSEVPLYGASAAGGGELLAGRADAVAQANKSDLVIFDWKSDVAPSQQTCLAHRE